MLNVKTPTEVLELIGREFDYMPGREETVPIRLAVGRVLAEDIKAAEYVPDFDRSTVDGYAVRARDTFGCSEAIPAILDIRGEVLMGQEAAFTLEENQCCYVPTGGAIPKNADACVMIEYTENYGDGTVGIAKAAAPGQNLIFRGDDVYPGKVLLQKGRVLASQDIGALAAIGQTTVSVVKKLKVGILSTGDELVEPQKAPAPGQIRDVNTAMLTAMLQAFGAEPVPYGIIIDEEAQLKSAVERAIAECDCVLISGGSSVGTKDVTCRLIENAGTLLMHGIAMKPGKPTILGKHGIKPLVGLPGHPVAAYFISRLFVLPLLHRLMGAAVKTYTTTAYLSESVGANDGRAQYSGVHLEEREGKLIAHPIRSKSGLITILSGSDGYFSIDRDCEGLPRGAAIEVTVCSGD